MGERIQWVDTAKFFGVFAIYLGHIGGAAGISYEFVFRYHVALFFLSSGCMSNYDRETNIVHFAVKKFKRIMIPFWLFNFLSIVVQVIYSNDVGHVKDYAVLVIKGNIRNTFFAGSLWFLPCLFLMELIFKTIKYLKNRYAILTVCLGMFIIAERVIEPRPVLEPHWLYNLDSVFYYIIFFGLGYIIYPYILNLFWLNTQWKRMAFTAIGSVCFVYSALLFLGKDYTMSVFNMIPVIKIFHPVLNALIIILFNLFVAKLLEEIDLFNKIGKDTLYLCGNEYIIGTLLVCFVSTFGLNINIQSPLNAYLYTGILLIVCLKVIILFEKRILYSVIKSFEINLEEKLLFGKLIVTP